MSLAHCFAGIATLFLVLLIHEFGHFLAAWAVGLRSSRIVVGLGACLFRFRARSWDLQINLFPVAGYVVLPDYEVTNYWRINGELLPIVFVKRKPALWKELLVFAAGPGANILAAVTLLAAAHADFGRLGRVEKARTAAHWKRSPAKRLAIELTYPMSHAAGPIGIVYTWVAASSHSIRNWLHYTAALNAAIAIFNLFPMFPLDGGRMVGSIICRIAPGLEQSRWTGRFINTQLALLGVLVLFAFWLDIEPFLHRFVPRSFG